MDEEIKHACEILLDLEDMYIERLSGGEDRNNIEPLRTAINALREIYKIENETLEKFDKYTRTARYKAIYSDVVEESNVEDGN